MCVRGVGSIAFKHTVGPKSIEAPECSGTGTAAIRGSVWTRRDAESSSRLSGLNSQSAVTEQRIQGHQSNLPEEGEEHGQTAEDQRAPSDG